MFIFRLRFRVLKIKAFVDYAIELWIRNDNLMNNRKERSGNFGGESRIRGAKFEVNVKG